MNNENNQREYLEIQATEIIIDALRESIDKNGQAVFTVPGGTSIRGIFSLLLKAEIDWNKVHIFLLDERWVPITDEDSNFKNLIENFTSHIDIPDENVHMFDMEKGVKEYQAQFEKVGGKIDVALIGSGEDGHMASLFPNHRGLDYEGKGYFEVNNSPKPPSRRISLSKKTISQSGVAVVLFFGEEKSRALENYNNDSVSESDCPVKIAKKATETFVITDIE